ncbi:histamine N-methyltransferase-like [Diadema antillarum]|uniref:histamine N-methyltransferase-like n=1 Tax=Diadema antillarum TaxID=105358 RepID=UPI003A8C0C5B
MEHAKLKPLMYDPDYYTKTFHAYAKRSAKFQVLSTWGDTVFPQQVVNRLVERFPADSTVQMLGIGSGSGEMDSKMAAKIRAHFKAVQNIVIEPAASQLEMYRKLIADGKEGFAGIDFDLREDTLDGYRRKLNETGVHPKYHFISAIHSVYYVDDLNDTIRYLHDCLEDGGMLLIIVVGDTSGFWNLWQRYARFQDKNSHYMCTQDLRDAFNANGIPFTVVRQASRVDITSCFDPESEEGNLIVDFLAHVCDLRGSGTPELHQEVLDYLGSAECSERKDDGTVLFNNDWDAFIVQKGKGQT